MSSVDLSFPKSARLLNAKDYQFVFEQAQSIGSRFLLLLHRENAINAPRLGIIVAKKQVKLAVRRNRIKRLVRESFRLHRHTLPAMDIIILARRGVDGLTNDEIRRDLEKKWQKLSKQYKSSPSG